MEEDYSDYLNSKQFEIDCLWTDVRHQVWQLSLHAEATDKALLDAISTALKKYQEEILSIKSNLLERASLMGLGKFSSFEELYTVLQPHPDEHPVDFMKSRRGELLSDWEGFNHSFQVDHLDGLDEMAILYARYGNVIAAHALLEVQLKKFCEFLSANRRSQIGLNDLAKRGSDLSRTRNYLEKVMDLHIESSLWEDLELYGEIRNCIAHRSGIVDENRDFVGAKKKERLKGKIEIVDGLLVTSTRTIDQYLDAILKFFDQLTSAASEWITIRLTK